MNGFHLNIMQSYKKYHSLRIVDDTFFVFQCNKAIIVSFLDFFLTLLQILVALALIIVFLFVINTNLKWLIRFLRQSPQRNEDGIIQN